MKPVTTDAVILPGEGEPPGPRALRPLVGHEADPQKGVYGLTIVGPNPMIGQPVAAIAWEKMRAKTMMNAGYAGPAAATREAWDTYRQGCSTRTIYDAGAGYIIYAEHDDPAVERLWLTKNPYTYRSLPKLLAEIFRTAFAGDPEYADAQAVCAAVVADLELPDEWWQAILTRGLKAGADLSLAGQHELADRFAQPKRNRPIY